MFAHHIGSECNETWSKIFQYCKEIEGFDTSERVTIVEQEKSIDSALKNVMENALIFLDPLHVKKT